MAEAYIIDAVRTPIGRKKGSLAAMHPADLGGHALGALMRRTGIDPGAVEASALLVDIALCDGNTDADPDRYGDTDSDANGYPNGDSNRDADTNAY